MNQNAYKQAGVDIEAGNELVNRIKPFAASTKRTGNMGNLGGFGAFFDLKATGYSDPILVSSTDGVGTKLKIAIESNRHEHIGQDLVAMCVNDLLVQGAEPLFFLDYFATSALSVDHAATVIQSIAKGCELAGCSLIGGETAEMPGLYAKGDYDLAGFSVGAVERHKMITGATIQSGDIVLGLASSGVHSNGYSLVRHIMDQGGVRYDAPAPFDTTKNMADILLTPTKIYVQSLLPILKEKQIIKGLAHITGGGLLENIPRILPDGLGVNLDGKSWNVPEVFSWLKRTGRISPSDMARTFNCGIGMILIVSPDHVKELLADLSQTSETVFNIGIVEQNISTERVQIQHWDDVWK
jgi:phosphoribosylformylglycinamidine cyclo-ligase